MNNDDKYRCLICGTPYDTAREMAECIVKCDEKKKAEEAASERKKLEEKRCKDLEEIINTEKLLYKKKQDYYDKYNENPNNILESLSKKHTHDTLSYPTWVLNNKEFEDLAKKIIGISW